MGFGNWFKSVGSFSGNTIRAVGALGSKIMNGVGFAKNTYDSINNYTGGIIGKTLEELPFVGAAVKGIGKFLNDKESIKTLDGTLQRLKVYSEDLPKLQRVPQMLRTRKRIK